MQAMVLEEGQLKKPCDNSESKNPANDYWHETSSPHQLTAPDTPPEDDPAGSDLIYLSLNNYSNTDSSSPSAIKHPFRSALSRLTQMAKKQEEQRDRQ